MTTMGVIGWRKRTFVSEKDFPDNKGDVPFLRAEHQHAESIYKFA